MVDKPVQVMFRCACALSGCERRLSVIRHEERVWINVGYSSLAISKDDAKELGRWLQEE